MRFFKTRLLCITLLAALFYLWPSQAQAQKKSSNQDTTNKVVRVIRFSGNEHISKSTLQSLIRIHTNREFLGIPRFTPWYFIWRLTGKFGERPALFNKSMVGNDIKRITQYYQTVGFLDAKVDTNVVEFKKNRVEISFIINEGKPYTIQTLEYSGMPAMADSTLVPRFLDDSPITHKRINDSTFTLQERYNEQDLSKERTRIITFLKNHGYAAVKRDSIGVLMKPDSLNSYHLDALFTIQPGHKYSFGDVHISLAGPDTSLNYQQQDTIRHNPSLTGSNNNIYLQKEKSAHTKFSLLTDQLLFKPGNTFNNDRYIKTVNEFQNLGMLNIREFGLTKNDSLTDYSKDQIPVSFSLQTLPRHSVKLNVFGMKRYGFGSGAGLTYADNNLFGSAENLQFNVNGSFEYVSSETFKNINPKADSSGASTGGRFFKSFEAQLDYSLPRLTFPFNGLDDNLFFSNSRTHYRLTLSRSDQLLFDINSDVRFNLRYEVDHNQHLTSFLDLIQLEILDADPTNSFKESLRNEFGENSYQYNRILEDFRPQISSLLQYTLQSKNTNIIQRNYGYYSQYTLGIGGNIPYLVDRFVVTPGTVEGTLPSIIKTSQNSLAYSRFFKGTADYRRYIPISKNGVFAYRGFMGLAYPYGQSHSVPLNQRFYAGGSNDLRAWDIYSLGPGGLSLNKVTGSGGDIKLLAQTEVRQKLFSLLSANWIGALFGDAGNIWYGPRTKYSTSQDTNTPAGQRKQTSNLGKFYFDQFYKQIAVDSGFGIRLDWDYVIARLDFAFRVHDLQQGWFKDKKLYISFGIGQSF